MPSGGSSAGNVVSSPSDDLLLIRVRCKDAASLNGSLPIEVEALLNYEAIFPPSDATLDVTQLDAASNQNGNLYGRLLGSAVFACEPVKAALNAIGQDRRTRVQLMLEGSGRHETLRWERMEVPGWTDGPISIGSDTPFSRYAAVNLPQEEAPEDRVFRMLLVVASPQIPGVYAIDPVAEAASVIDACQDLLSHGQMAITLLPGAKGLDDAAKARLNRQGVSIEEGPSTSDRIAKLLPGQFHGLHFIGHGTYNSSAETFHLLLESDDGGPGAKESQYLIQQWQLQRLRFVFLESCQSAVTSTPGDDLRPHVNGFMRQLVAAGVPGVVAMQDVIQVKDARTFNEGFYSSLLYEGFADQAVNHGRRCLYRDSSPAWSIPAFMTRLKRGAVWRESPLRRAQRKMAAALTTSRADRQYSDFPIDVISLNTDALKSSMNGRSNSLIDNAELPEGVRIDIQAALAPIVSRTSDVRTACLLSGHGAAKTTTLETIYLSELQKHWDETQLAVPVLFRLSDCVPALFDEVSTIARAVSRYFADYDAKVDAAELADCFRQQTVLFLVDADSDFTQGTPQQALKTLQTFQATMAQRSHNYVVTLDQNTIAVRDLPDNSQCLVVQPMSVERVGKYLRNLPSTGNSANVGQKLFAVLEECGLFDLAEVPWLLVEMLDQARRGVLGTSRAAILKRIVDERIARFAVPEMRARVEDAVYRFAWEIQQNLNTTLTGSEAFRILAELRGNRDYALFDFRGKLTGSPGILTAASQEGIRFAYPGFRAYCCAQYILSQPGMERMLTDITSTLGRRSRVSWWEETLYVVAGLWPDTGLLLRMILSGSPLNEGSQVFVAARCLQEARQAFSDSGPVSDPIVRSIVSTLIYRSHPLSLSSVPARKQALEYLGPLKEPDAVPHLISLVLRRLRPGTDGHQEFDYSGVRLTAIKALLYTQDQALQQIKADPEWQEHMELQDTLESWLTFDYSKLQSRLKSYDSLVASIAAFALGLTKPHGALKAMSDRFLSDESNPDLLWAIADSMLELGDRDLRDVVSLCLDRHDRWDYGAYLIGKIGITHVPPLHKEFLLAHVSEFTPETKVHNSDGLRGRCLQALSELQDTSILPTCQEWLAMPSSTLRYYALQALRRVGDLDSLALLERLQWDSSATTQGDARLFQSLRLEVYEDLYWRLAGGLSREVMVLMQPKTTTNDKH